jgi:hypothetical protein
MTITTLNQKMARFILIAGILFCTIESGAQSQFCSRYASAHPAFKWSGLQPVVLLTEYNPWASAIGSDTATIALYTDGTVIYWQGDRRSGEYVTNHLSPAQVDEFLTTSNLRKPQQFDDCYNIDNVTDLPTNVLVVKTEQSYKTITVYGVIRHNDTRPPLNTVPSALQKIFDTLLGFHVDGSRPWTPPCFELIIWPFTYAKSALAWPIDFPTLRDDSTVKDENSYRLFVPISKLNEYEALEKRRKPTQALLLDGKKWAVSARFPFPHEPAPQKAPDVHP